MKKYLIALILSCSLPSLGHSAVLADSEIIANGQIVTIGDIFLGAGEKAELPALAAPAAGKKIQLDALALQRLARQFNIAWQPSSRDDRVIISRAAEIIDQEQLRNSLLPLLAEKISYADYQLLFDNKNLQMILPAETASAISAELQSFDPDTGRFVAIFKADAEPKNSLRAVGRVTELQEVPVLIRRVMPGSVITAEDVMLKKIIANNIPNDALLQVNDLVGLTPRRAVAVDRPIRRIDLQRPLLVRKGEMVEITLDSPNLQLVVDGRALQDGSQGDIIRVANSRSQRIIEASISGERRVVVSPRLQPIALSQPAGTKLANHQLEDHQLEDHQLEDHQLENNQSGQEMPPEGKNPLATNSN